jgi:LysM repeat protein
MRYALLCAAFTLLAPAAALSAPRARAASAQPAQRYHVVRDGQTLGKIARLYRLSIRELCLANGIRQNARIRPRQKLVLPSGEVPAELGFTAETANGAAKAVSASAQPPSEGRRRSATSQPTASRPPKPQRDKNDFSKAPKRRGYVVLFGPNGSWQGQVMLADGELTAAARRGFMKVLAAWRSGDREKIHGDLIRLVARVSDHFGGRPIRVVSGYRPASPWQYTPHSRHNEGRAVDFSIPGVPNAVVRDYCRTLGTVGVGYYPNSSFVHLDVREIPTYWIDYAGPGQAPQYAHAGARKQSTAAMLMQAATTPANAPSGATESNLTQENMQQTSADTPNQ